MPLLAGLPGAEPAIAERALRRSRLRHDHLEMRILGEGDGAGLGRAAAIPEHDRDAIARFVPAEHSRNVTLAGYPLPVELLELVVLVDAGRIERPGRRNQVRDPQATAGIEPHVAEPGAARVAPADREPGVGEQPRVIGDLVT